MHLRSSASGKGATTTEAADSEELSESLLAPEALLAAFSVCMPFGSGALSAIKMSASSSEDVLEISCSGLLLEVGSRSTAIFS